MKQLLRCPHCFKDHKEHTVLGEFIDGSFVVMRFWDSTTIINSPSFSITCGVCEKTVFVRISNKSRQKKSDPIFDVPQKTDFDFE